jgi:hypothetical protein
MIGIGLRMVMRGSAMRRRGGMKRGIKIAHIARNITRNAFGLLKRRWRRDV